MQHVWEVQHVCKMHHVWEVQHVWKMCVLQVGLRCRREEGRGVQCRAAESKESHLVSLMMMDVMMEMMMMDVMDVVDVMMIYLGTSL